MADVLYELATMYGTMGDVLLYVIVFVLLALLVHCVWVRVKKKKRTCAELIRRFFLMIIVVIVLLPPILGGLIYILGYYTRFDVISIVAAVVSLLIAGIIFVFLFWMPRRRKKLI